MIRYPWSWTARAAVAKLTQMAERFTGRWLCFQSTNLLTEPLTLTWFILENIVIFSTRKLFNEKGGEEGNGIGFSLFKRPFSYIKICHLPGNLPWFPSSVASNGVYIFFFFCIFFLLFQFWSSFFILFFFSLFLANEESVTFFFFLGGDLERNYLYCSFVRFKEVMGC